MTLSLLFLGSGGVESGDHGLYHSLLGKWRSVIIVTHSHFQREEGKRDHCHPLTLSEGSMENGAICCSANSVWSLSPPLTLTSTGKQGRGDHDPMAFTLLFLGSGGV